MFKGFVSACKERKATVQNEQRWSSAIWASLPTDRKRKKKEKAGGREVGREGRGGAYAWVAQGHCSRKCDQDSGHPENIHCEQACNSHHNRSWYWGESAARCDDSSCCTDVGLPLLSLVGLSASVSVFQKLIKLKTKDKNTVACCCCDDQSCPTLELKLQAFSRALEFFTAVDK